LKNELKLEIEALQDADTDLRLELLAEIDRLDGRVDDVIDSTESQFRSLWGSYVLLQAQILAVSISNTLEHARLRGEITRVENLLRQEVANLNAADAALLSQILDLQQSQTATQAQLNALQERFEAFEAEQMATNAAVDSRFSAMTGSIQALKLSLEGQISTQSERINRIMGVILPRLSLFVLGLQFRADAMAHSLAGLQTSLIEQRADFEALATQHQTLRDEFDAYAQTTSGEISQLSTMLADIESCDLVFKDRLILDYAVLTCGTTTVEFYTK
jgi:predicted  nucleic acid-binding Zn-ribbon protein